jgi:hypothetical protein
MWPAHNADNLTAISEPIVYTMWDQHLTTLQSSTACYRESFTYLPVFLLHSTDFDSSSPSLCSPAVNFPPERSCEDL